jgi:predicted RNA-binding Zn ribbon-like protein
VSAKATTSAPHGLDLPIDFVNSLDVDAHTDALSSPAELTAWLADAGLIAERVRPATAGDHVHAIELREALRALMLANNGEDPDPRAGRELELAARRGKLGVHFADTGAVSLLAGAQGVDGALARVLIPIAHALEDGTWQRVKACRAHDCQWAFYDRSRNRSGVWCEMAVCGNRTKVRAYRERAPRRRG